MVRACSKAALRVKSVRKHLCGVRIFLCRNDDRLHLHLLRKRLRLSGELLFFFVRKKIRHIVDIGIVFRSLRHAVRVLTGRCEGSSREEDPKDACCQENFQRSSCRSQNAPVFPTVLPRLFSYPLHFHHRNHPPIIRIAATGTKISRNSFTSFPFATGSFPQIFPVCPFIAK